MKRVCSLRLPSTILSSAWEKLSLSGRKVWGASMQATVLFPEQQVCFLLLLLPDPLFIAYTIRVSFLGRITLFLHSWQ